MNTAPGWLAAIFGQRLLRLILGVIIASASVSCGAPPAAAPPREGMQEVNGTRLYYKVIGTGDPIIVLHGGPGLSHGVFLPHLEALSDEHQLVFYDQRGTGASDGALALEALTIPQFVEDLEALRVALGLEKILLLGHSWGAALAMHYAVAHPDQLERLILVAPGSVNGQGWTQERAAFERRLTPELARALASACQLADREQTPEALAGCFKVVDRITFFDPAKTATMDYTVEANTAKNFRIVNSMLGQSVRNDIQLEATIKTIQVPTLIVHGEQDTFPVSASERIHQLIPSSELVVISKSGHFPFVEQPELFYAAVQQFLDT